MEITITIGDGAPEQAVADLLLALWMQTKAVMAAAGADFIEMRRDGSPLPGR